MLETKKYFTEEKMIKENLSIDLIAKITDKTEEEILEIKKLCE